MALTLALAASGAAAQGTSATLAGTVTDGSDAPLAGARLELLATETGVGRGTTTDRFGRYRFLALPPGPYSLTVAAPGLAAQTRVLRVGVGRDAAADFELSTAPRSESMDVVAEASAGGPTQGARVDGATLREMPLNGRDLGRLVLLQPGALWSRTSVQSNATGRGTRFSVGGARPSQNLFVIDGTIVNDALNHTPGSASGAMLGAEAVEEFRLVTGVAGAEYGRAGGAVMVAITRQGTNQWRGSAFELVRDDALDARNTFDRDKPAFRRHQFGGSIGGPLRPGRTFLFASYEGLRESRGVTQVALVPDLAARSGVLAGRSLGVDPRAAPLLALYPLPNGRSFGDGSAEFVGVLDRDAHHDVASVRLDHDFSGGDAVFARYFFEDSSQVVPRTLPQFPNVARNRKHVVTGEGRKALGSATLLTVRLGLSRSRPAEEIVASGSAVQFVAGRSLGEITVPGLADLGTDRGAPARFAQDDIQAAAELLSSRGGHLFKLGAAAQRLRLDGAWENRNRGQLRFRSIEDLMRFRVQDLQGAAADSDFERRYSQWVLGAFVQDEWQVSDRLRLDFGLRWERATSPRELDGKAANLREAADRQITLGNPLFEAQAWNFAPRLGLTWATGRGRRSQLRGGVGLFDDLPLFNVWRGTAFRGLPYANRGRIAGANVRSLPVDPGAFAAADRITDSIEFELPTSRLLQWSLAWETRVMAGLEAGISYSGSRGFDLLSLADVNTALPSTDAAGLLFYPEGGLRRNPAFDVVRRVIGGFRSDFHALGVTLSRNTRGARFQVAWQLSRAQDDGAGFGALSWSNGQSRTFDPDRPALDWGPANFDVRHALKAVAALEAPWRLSGLSGALLNAWRLDLTGLYQAGDPFSVVIDGDPDRDGTDQNDARPDRVPGVSLRPAGGPSAAMWFNLGAFVPPAPGYRGNASRNALTGPDFLSVDLALARSFTLRGRLRLEARLEAFNLLNRVNLANPQNADGGQQVFTYVPPAAGAPARFDPTPGAGRIFQTAGDARELQLGMRVTF
ncbi:MAG: TonB-dependent receptor [Vicinamibacteria bacterium]|nr:TonB-dependent receptor [Vicinamibacteria bacterium]